MKNTFKLKILKRAEPLQRFSGNRKVEPRKVKSLVESLKLYGQLRPIILGGATEETAVIIDGQHLYEALKVVEFPVYYVFVQITTLEDLIKFMAKMNSTAKSWNLANYIDAFALINEDVNRIRRYIKLYTHVHTDMVVNIMAGKYSSGGTATNLKKGIYKIQEEALNEKFLKELNDFLGVVFRINASRKTALAKEYVAFRMKLTSYNHAIFMNTLSGDAEFRRRLSVKLPDSNYLYEMYMKIMNAKSKLKLKSNEAQKSNREVEE